MNEDDRFSFFEGVLPSLPVFCSAFPVLLPVAQQLLKRLYSSCLAHSSDPLITHVGQMLVSHSHQASQGVDAKATLVQQMTPFHLTQLGAQDAYTDEFTSTRCASMSRTLKELQLRLHGCSVSYADETAGFADSVAALACTEGKGHTREQILALKIAHVYRRLLLCIPAIRDIS